MSPALETTARKRGSSGALAPRDAVRHSGRHGEPQEVGVPRWLQRQEAPRLQPKLRVNQPGDAHEQEAERVAEQVMAKPAQADVSPAPPRIQRLSEPSTEQNGAAPASVEHALVNPGRPLEPPLRHDMEQRIGHDFSSVRVHSGAAAEQSARDVNAQAYTVGQDVVFGAGRFAPQTGEGRQLLAHELTHVVQQSGAGPTEGRGASRPLPVAPFIQRQPAPGPTPPAVAPQGRKWKDVLADIVYAGISARARLPALVQELLEVAEAPGYDLDLLNDAMRVVADLSQQGDIPAADRLLEVIRRKFLTAYVTEKDLPSGGVLRVGSRVLGDPGVLIAVAQDAARAGQHERAFKLFGAAHEILSYLALAATEKAKATTDVSKRYSRYSQFKGIYDEMREIYRFYFVLEAEALAAGEPKRAAEARDRASKLHHELKAHHTPFPESAAEIAETSQVTTPTGRPAFEFHGANFEKTDLTELPGHPFSAELLATGEGQEPQNLGLLQSSLMAQAEFQAEIAREPEIRKAFGHEPVDLNDSAKRLKVWRIMHAVYQRRGSGALGSLMALMGRYLKAHTYHTGFNVRDFGTSYLASEMPSDLAGRLVRDCGVYALTVAWDVFQTVKAGDSKLQLSFTLATLLDHIILVITDKAAGESYLVNNDQITKISRPIGYLPQFTGPEGMGPTVCLGSEDAVIPPPKGARPGRGGGETVRPVPRPSVPRLAGELSRTRLHRGRGEHLQGGRVATLSRGHPVHGEGAGEFLDAAGLLEGFRRTGPAGERARVVCQRRGSDRRMARYRLEAHHLAAGPLRADRAEGVQEHHASGHQAGRVARQWRLPVAGREPSAHSRRARPPAPAQAGPTAHA
jgi:Domain of unknown function (DUF4157)